MAEEPGALMAIPMVVIFEPQTPRPTFHEPLYDGGRVAVTLCGRALPASPSWVRRDHAEIIGRPCDHCRAAA